MIHDMSAAWPIRPRIVVGDDERHAAFRSARAALAKSGTVTLELALSGVPMVTAYRGTTWEAFIEVAKQYSTKTGKGLIDSVKKAFNARI